MTDDWKLATQDRVEQVNWLVELAGNIAANLIVDWPQANAEELVQYTLSREGRESWGITIPDWYRLHDHELLIKYVAESL